MHIITAGFVDISKPKRLRILGLFLSFYIGGLLLAIWCGVGWYFLIQALRRLAFESPQIYTFILSVVINGGFADKERERLLGDANKIFISKTSLFNFLISLLIALLFFWKANTSIIEIIDLYSR